MTPALSQPAFPLRQAVSLLTGVAVLLLAGGVVVTRFIAPSDAGFDAMLFAGIVVWLASVLGVIPVAIVGQRGVMPAVYASFIGMGLRLALTFAAAIAAVRAGRLEGLHVAVWLAVFYLPLLAVEITLVGRYLWHKDFLASHPTRPEATA